MAIPQKPTHTPTTRLPAPTLFVGPPSRNTSTTSLHRPTTADPPTKPPLTRQRSLLSPDPRRAPQSIPAPTSPNVSNHLSLTSHPNTITSFLPAHTQQSLAATPDADTEATSKAEAAWAEMQNTLEEVELSAMKGPGMTVFGAEHSRALEGLRAAQIELAKAWARGGTGAGEDESEGIGGEDRIGSVGGGVDGVGSGGKKGGAGRASDAKPGTGKEEILDRMKLEAETERDMELSRRRREENDRYFDKMNEGVQEVVLRLEEVAKAMRAVESESKEIWGRGDGLVEEGSVATAPSVG